MQRLVVVCAMLALTLLSVVFPSSVLASPDVPGAPQGTKTGAAVPVFLLGASADIDRHGMNRVVLEQGWAAAVDLVFVPRLLEFYGPPPAPPAPDKATSTDLDSLGARGPPATPATRRVIFHLPFGRAPIANADMPFDGLCLLKERASDKSLPDTLRAQLARAADGEEFVRAMTRLIARTGCVPEYYLGTVDAGNAAQWSKYSPSEWSKRADASAGVFRKLQTSAAKTLDGRKITVYIDAGGVQDENSNSWEMCLTLRRMDVRPAVEPWPAIKAPQWATTSGGSGTGIPVLITSQLFDHLGSWSVPRERVEGRVTILFTGGGLGPGSMNEAKVLGWMRDGFDVAVGAFVVEKTSEEWAAAVLGNTGGGGAGDATSTSALTSTTLAEVEKP